MTKKDIIQAISEELGHTQLQTSQIVHHVFDSIVNALVEEGRVELRNFGVFEVRWRNAYQGRNPRTGEKFMVPKRCVVIFKPGQAVDALGRRSPISIATVGRVFLEENLGGSPKVEARAGGRLLSSFSTCRTSEWEMSRKSVPLGKYCRIRPLVFSFVPR